MAEHGHAHGASTPAGHGHAHGHAAMRSLGKRALQIALFLNAVFLVVETVAGFASGSLALISDAGHMLSDVAALAIALLGVRLAERPADGSYTFGLRRAPVLAALVNSLVLIGITIMISIEAIERFQHPAEIDGPIVIVVGFAGLFVNVLSAVLLHRSGDQSVNARAAMVHLAADALGSVGAILAGLVAYFDGWVFADPVASLVIALMIAMATVPLLRQAFQIVLQRAPAFIGDLRETLRDTEGVSDVLDLHVWELDDGEAIVSARLLTESDLPLPEANAIADMARQRLEEKFNIVHATIEMRSPHAPELSCGPGGGPTR